MIFDRNGRLLADNQNAASLALVADRLTQRTATLDFLGELLALSLNQKADIQQRLGANRRPDTPLIVVDSDRVPGRAPGGESPSTPRR